MKDNKYLVGVISDTHGLLRPAAVRVLRGVDLIVHAGDIDRPGLLKSLNAVAPVEAVRGNMDRGRWAHELPRTKIVKVGKIAICVVHDINLLDPARVQPYFQVIVHGHTHQASIEGQDGWLMLNPGSAGRRHHTNSPTLALLHIVGEALEAEIIPL